MLKQILAGGSILALMLLGSLPTQAQTSQPAPQPPAQAPPVQVSPEELKKFANSVKQILAIEQGAQAEMVKVVRAEGFNEQRFIEIHRGQQSPQGQPKAAVTPAEKQKYDQVYAKIGEIQKQSQAKMAQAIQSQGLQIPRFNEILVAVRQNPSLRQQVQQMIKS